MEAHVREQLEREVRDLLEAGDPGEATTRAIKGFGPEILGFLVGTTRVETDAVDAFSVFCEHLWQGLPGFRWECSLRTWCYVLARRAASRNARGRRAVAHLSTGAMDRIVDTITTATLPFVRAQQRAQVVALRESLEPADRMLLALRVDKELDWRDVARVMAEAEADEADSDSDRDLDRRAALLRKRFERVKKKLRELAEAQGLS
jgi:RNA polymerase sigma-70 factor (ECF subfamily)